MEAQELDDRFALRELTYRYARLVDDRAYDDIPTVFTEDALLEGPGYKMTGHAELQGGLEQIEMYSATLHCVHNHLVKLAGDEATGEAYCVANHLYEADGIARKLDMGIRYTDRYRREDGHWRIAKRVLHLIWDQDLPQKG
jgi:ketosteroid isomerase-like protein